MPRSFLARLVFLTTILAFIVVVLGAYVRLSDAGLGCPDWPGCYGQFYPNNLLEAHKAWKEMIHRYFAGTLGLLIIAIALFSTLQRKKDPSTPLFLPWFLVGLVLFQALLGMWTVTLELHPVVVMGHLLGGMATLALLWWLFLSRGAIHPIKRGRSLCGGAPGVMNHAPTKTLQIWIFIGLITLILQIALGGWVSANYAALACPDFPTCQTHWWPPLDLKGAFLTPLQVGLNYEGGIFGNEIRMTIHWIHRVGAFVTFLVLSTLSLALLRQKFFRFIGLTLLLLLILQITLGIANVLMIRPLIIAVAHNATAALLLLTVIRLKSHFASCD